MRKSLLVLAALSLMAPAAFAGSAGSGNPANNVSATVVANCTVSTFALAFGNYDPLSGTDLDAQTTVNVYCTKGATGTVSLDLGVNASGATRRMTDGTNFMNYEVYKNAGRTVIWNAANTNSAVSTSKSTALSGGFTAYGRVPAGQDLPLATFYDTLQATVNF